MYSSFYIQSARKCGWKISWSQCSNVQLSEIKYWQMSCSQFVPHLDAIMSWREMTWCIHHNDITTMQPIHCLVQIFYSPVDVTNIFSSSIHTIMTSSGHMIQRKLRQNTFKEFIHLNFYTFHTSYWNKILK